MMTLRCWVEERDLEGAENILVPAKDVKLAINIAIIPTRQSLMGSSLFFIYIFFQ
jgi:hypothetical protein